MTGVGMCHHRGCPLHFSDALQSSEGVAAGAAWLYLGAIFVFRVQVIPVVRSAVYPEGQGVMASDAVLGAVDVQRRFAPAQAQTGNTGAPGRALVE